MPLEKSNRARLLGTAQSPMILSEINCIASHGFLPSHSETGVLRQIQAASSGSFEQLDDILAGVAGFMEGCGDPPPMPDTR
jgi:hypothetical protein